MNFLLASLFWWQVNLGAHKYPAGAQFAFVEQVMAMGATEKQAKCDLKLIEDTWTFDQALGQLQYYFSHWKLSTQAQNIYNTCHKK